MAEEQSSGRAVGGKARMAQLTPEQRSAGARKAALAKALLAQLPRATHGGEDHPLKIGEVAIPCYVLEDGRRVLAQRGMVAALGMSRGGSSKGGGDRLAHFVTGKALEPFVGEKLRAVIESPIQFKTPTGLIANAYDAQILADICEAVLNARAEGKLQKQQAHIAQQCEILMRGFARVGIIALIDEATGYQKDRAKDALAKILEAFVAKELQPWVKTFPAEYYEELFRIYGLPFPPEGNRNWRPQFFGRITNSVVYDRLAPELLPELKKAASKAERKARLHQWLTNDRGHPKLREHLASIVTLLKLSNTPKEFRRLVDRIHPPFGQSREFDFGEFPEST